MNNPIYRYLPAAMFGPVLLWVGVAFAGVEKGGPRAGKLAAPKPPFAVGHPAMESPQFNPIAVSGERVFVANTPAGTVDVIDSKTRKVVTRIAVDRKSVV